MKDKKSGFLKKIILTICIIIAILAIILTILIKSNKLKIATPVIYYTHEDGLKIPLLVNNTTFSNNTKITWTKNCRGVIKKDGKEISKENGITIEEEGTYEITATSIISRKSVTKTLNIDRTPPNVEIKQNPSGTYTITFEDTNDVGIAKLKRFDLETFELISEVDLTQGGLQKNIEITENGHYNLRIEDYYGNLVSKNTTFSIN